LGKVEQYIAESYKTRSFIELIQNADDANSSVFGIYSIDNMLVVANNGRQPLEWDVFVIDRTPQAILYRMQRASRRVKELVLKMAVITQ
jgi:hypothetical protein